MLLKISTLRLAITMMPRPCGTVATIFPSGAKLGVLLLREILLNTRMEWPPCWGRLGRSNTRKPPVLLTAVLS